MPQISAIALFHICLLAGHVNGFSPSTTGVSRGSVLAATPSDVSPSVAHSCSTQWKRTMGTAVLSVVTTLLPLVNVLPVYAAEATAQAPIEIPTSSGSRIVGSLSGSGLFFKDTLEIEAFDDPKVKGVKLYISNFQIPLTERLSKKNFFNDPSYASVACARGNRVALASNIAKGPAGEEVFEESKSLLFKTLRVQRIYDEPSNTLIYVSFNTRLDKNDDSNKSRFKSSLCAINLD